MSKKSLVTVITPMYNSVNSIEKTINSVINQTYENWEMIIVDDMSTDESPLIVQGFIEKDSRIKLINLKEKGGASIARNTGIKNADGKYVAFLDADDTWEPKKLETQIDVMEREEYVFTYTNYFINEDGKELYKKNCPESLTFKQLLKRNRIGCLTVVYNREVIKDLSIPRLNKRNDFALWLVALSKGHTAYLINEYLSTYFVSANSLSNRNGKADLIKYHYQMYREVLHFNRIYSTFCTARNIFYNIVDRI